jgi:hypothetical protein
LHNDAFVSVVFRLNEQISLESSSVGSTVDGYE